MGRLKHKPMLADDLAKKLAKGRISVRIVPEQAEKLMLVHQKTGIKNITELISHVLHEYDLSAEQKQGAA